MITTTPYARSRPGLLISTLAGLIAVAVVGCQVPSSAQVADGSSDVRPEDYLITAEVLPKDWRASNDPGTDYRTTVCGVDLEPSDPAAKTSVRFSMGPFGPFLEQHVRSYSDDTAERVINGLADAVPGCGSYDATGTKGTKTATFRVEPLRLDSVGREIVSWRQRTDASRNLTTDLAFFRRGNTVIAMQSYSIGKVPDPAVLEQAIKAVPE